MRQEIDYSLSVRFEHERLMVIIHIDHIPTLAMARGLIDLGLALVVEDGRPVAVISDGQIVHEVNDCAQLDGLDQIGVWFTDNKGHPYRETRADYLDALGNADEFPSVAADSDGREFSITWWSIAEYRRRGDRVIGPRPVLDWSAPTPPRTP